MVLMASIFVWLLFFVFVLCVEMKLMEVVDRLVIWRVFFIVVIGFVVVFEVVEGWNVLLIFVYLEIVVRMGFFV